MNAAQMPALPACQVSPYWPVQLRVLPLLCPPGPLCPSLKTTSRRNAGMCSKKTTIAPESPDSESYRPRHADPFETPLSAEEARYLLPTWEIRG